MPPAVKVALKWIILAVTIVAGLGPIVSELAGVLPPTWLLVATRVVATAGAIHLWLSESPLLQPLLATKSPAAVIEAAETRARKESPPPPAA